MRSILIVGSGPGAVLARAWSQNPFDHTLAINNAWQVRQDWDSVIFPDDFAPDRQPRTDMTRRTTIRSGDYVPVQNRFGGFVYAGGTMAFTAAYWALGTHEPQVIAMIGCDMIYPTTGPTHFYGTGRPDPLRNDISLRSLPAKSARLMALAAQRGCAMVNLSDGPSQLTFPRAHPSSAAAHKPLQHSASAVAAALAEEARLGYYVPSGKYWKEATRFDPVKIDALDAMWLALRPPLQ
uniref:hypothetical protein n=1 Tax=Yoonia sp. TaxID=2212373 RepID=UPI00404781A2